MGLDWFRGAQPAARPPHLAFFLAGAAAPRLPLAPASPPAAALPPFLPLLRALLYLRHVARGVQINIKWLALCIQQRAVGGAPRRRSRSLLRRSAACCSAPRRTRP